MDHLVTFKPETSNTNRKKPEGYYWIRESYGLGIFPWSEPRYIFDPNTEEEYIDSAPAEDGGCITYKPEERNIRFDRRLDFANIGEEELIAQANNYLARPL